MILNFRIIHLPSFARKLGESLAKAKASNFLLLDILGITNIVLL